jgi:enamine deaminase RidA (YjgF/YER057c/UK114 family)
MEAVTLLSPKGLITSPAFSHVALIPPGATTVLVGGQNSVDASGQLVGHNDLARQTDRAMQNLTTALDSVGATLHDLVSVMVLIQDGYDVADAYPVAAGYLSRLDAPPLLTVAMVSGLAVPGALVEISAMAALLR